MSEFPNGDEQRDTYVNALLSEKSDNEQHLDAAEAAGKDTKEIVEHLKAIDVELARLGVKKDEADEKTPVRQPRPGKPVVETR